MRRFKSPDTRNDFYLFTAKSTTYFASAVIF